jgi:hypothetical protein
MCYQCVIDRLLSEVKNTIENKGVVCPGKCEKLSDADRVQNKGFIFSVDLSKGVTVLRCRTKSEHAAKAEEKAKE